MRVDYNPYEGRIVQGAPSTVLSRGDVIVYDGKLKAKAGRGRFVKRDPGGPLVP